MLNTGFLVRKNISGGWNENILLAAEQKVGLKQSVFKLIIQDIKNFLRCKK